MVIVNKLSKSAHFLALAHPFTALTAAPTFLDQIYKLHRAPADLVSDQDEVFLSHFWQEFFKLLGTQLHLSTAYHPQMNGQTKLVNQCFEPYLRCMTSKRH